jgi:hypothetical protein
VLSDLRVFAGLLFALVSSGLPLSAQVPYQINSITNQAGLKSTSGVVTPNTVPAGANGGSFVMTGTLPTVAQQASSPASVCFYTGYTNASVTPSAPFDTAGDETFVVQATVLQSIPLTAFNPATGSVSASVYLYSKTGTCSATPTGLLSNVVTVKIVEPVLSGYTGSANIPQTNSATGIQAPPTQIVLTGSNFASNTVAVLYAYPAISMTVTPTSIRSNEVTIALPASFTSMAAGTSASITLGNSGNTSGGTTLGGQSNLYFPAGQTSFPLTITALAPSAGTLTVSPTPITTLGTTTATAQFKRSTTTGTTLPEPGAPSGTVTFTANGTTAEGSAPLVLDTTAVLVAVNSSATVQATPTPVISPAAGNYPSAQMVTLSDSAANASIYYTLDGTTPSSSSTLYTGAITVSTTTTVTAIAYMTGDLPSATAAGTFTIFTPIPTSLAFLQQPTTTAINTPIAPPVTVEILDQNGNLIANSTLPVALSFSSNPGQSQLGGTTTVNAVNGIATFSNLTLGNVANGYALAATSSGLVQAVSTTFNVTPPPIMVTPFAPLVGVTSTLPGTFTLSVPAPAGGVTVTLVSSATGNVTVSPSTVTVPAGQTVGNFTYTGVGPGAATITASAANYFAGSATVTGTYSLVSLGTIPAVAPGQSVSIALSIATAAPAGGLTVSFTSSNPSVATVTSSVVIPAGQRTAVVNPQIVGVTIGTTTITATAPGYAPDTRAVNVTVTASFSPGSITIAHQTYQNVTLNISYPATTGGLTFTLSSDTPATATVPASITIPAGQTSANISLTGVADGSTTIRADSPGVTEATLGVGVSTQLSLYYGNSITGVNMQVADYAYVPTTPATPFTETVTVSDPTIVLMSTSQSVAGTGTLTFPNITSSTNSAIYFQGQKTGTVTVTMSAPGYTTGTNTITVYPGGFILAGGGGTYSTTTFSSPSGLTVYPAILNPTTLTDYTTSTLNPGIGPISVPVTSSNTAIGTITTSPVVFNGSQSSQTTSFQPSTAGTTTISIGSPTGGTGFSTASNTTSLTETVTAPQLSFYNGNQTTGVNMMVTNYIYVPLTPPTATTYTVTSSNPAVAVISTSTTTVGTASLTLPNVTGDGNVQQISIQGLSVGTSTLTVSGSGFTSGTMTITVYPSGFSFGGNYNGGLSTTTFSTATQIPVTAVILNPTTLTQYTGGTLSPGVGPISVPVTSSNTTTGTITTSPVVFTSGSSSLYTSFQPSNAGTSTISVGTPTGMGSSAFSTPAQYTSFTATVTAPQAGIYYGSPIIGVDMIAGNYAYLPVSPPNPVTVTVTSSNPAVATISSSSTVVGTASVTLTNVSATTTSIYFQGLSAGTTTITVSAPGYTTGTTTVTVYPSGFTFAGQGGFSTTTFSSPSSFNVYPSVLNPSNLTYYTNGTLSPGVGPFSIPVISSNTTAGTITTSPVVLTAGSSSASTSFQPLSAGMSTLSLGTATGTGVGVFSTPSQYTSFPVTVTAPQLSFYTSVITGVNLQQTTNVYLPVAPPNPVTVTVTSNGPAIATLSESATTVGTTAVTFTNVTNAGYVGAIYVQGQAQGSTTITASAAGYTNAVTTVTVNPSGFTFAGSYSSGLSTSSTSSPVSLPIYPSILNPGTLTYYGQAYFNPGLGGTDVVVTSSNTAVGTITTSPVVFNGGESYIYTSFKPLTDGTTNVNIVQPAGFSTPSQYTGFTATVTN